MKWNALDTIALVLVLVGGLNWGLVGLFSFDLVRYLFVDLVGASWLAAAVYILVGISAVYLIFAAPMKSSR